MRTSFSELAIKLIKRIPKGKVATYGQIAAMAGSPQGARQVVRILHACSSSEHLPWHRVINSKGQIGLRPGEGYELQKARLENEGVAMINGRIDLEIFGWKSTPRKKKTTN